MQERFTVWDRIGMGLSGVCLVHCLLVPVVLALLPLWPVGEAVHAWMHPVLALGLVPVTLVALVAGYRRHRSREVVALLLSGLAVVLVAATWGHASPGAVGETTLTVAGSILLMVGHWRNWRRTGTCHLH